MYQNTDLVKSTIDWRVEKGTEEKSTSPLLFGQPSGQTESLDIAVENPEECVLWYYNYFLGKSHQNYLGVLDNGDVFGASIIKEDYNVEGEYSYKTIIWTIEGIERQWFQVKQKQSLTPTEIIKKALPRLSIKKIKEIDSVDLLKDFKDLEATQTEIFYKFGILLARPGQSTEDEFYNNNEYSPRWTEFLNLLGDTVVLNSFKGYRGGLDVNSNTTGTHSLYTSLNGYEVMFHVSTMLPHSKADSQQIERKRHLGNDIVIIIFYDCDPSDPIIPWDPSKINSNFNHIFAIVRPVDDNHYHVEIVIKNGIAKFGPKLPTHSIFPKCQNFKEFLITKLVNGQRAALNSAPSFASKLKRTFKDQLESICKKYSLSSSSTISSFVPKRRSSSVSNVNKGKELKAKDPKYGSGFFKLKESSKSQIFDTEILFSKSLNERINCLDVLESDENNCTLIVATDESIYLLKTNISTGEQLFQKVINIKDVTRVTIIKPLNVLLVLTSKGLVFYEMEQIFQHFKNSSSNSSVPTTHSIPIPTNHLNHQQQQQQQNSSYGNSPGYYNNSPNAYGSLRWSKSGIIAANIINNNQNSQNFNNGITEEQINSIKMKKILGTKGCTVYGYTKGDSNSSEEDITLLYVGLKKTLILYEWNRGDFVKTKELVVSDNIKTLCAIAPGMICVGIAKEFLLIDIFTQTIKELYKKADSEPVKALSLDSEILLCFNNIGIFVDESGVKTRSFELKWGSTPSSLALVPAYVLGISGPLIEVRTLLNGNIIQSLPANISLDDNNCIIEDNNNINNNNINNNSNNNSSNSINSGNNLELENSFNNITITNNSNHNLNNNNCINNNNNNNNSSNNINIHNSSGSITSVTSIDSNDHQNEGNNNNSGIENVYSFSTFNDIAHVDNGNIYVASSSKGLSCILRIHNIQNSLAPITPFSPPNSPLKPNFLKN
ncbi:hypothetical protein DICPUDRAFT_80637 [Dictyostelium purpureum]|uniref:Rap-GAP domain-containing protein n=1 Tax=Dictyostelium purpureum TaxID=5786 RepID=F0ZR31_DICPU|nr:uncharacterized protein DICPUDRAFT_80637 [Dictyostelium purpureum]EGC33613.1 hypothetical protein DICPUDRAFT_80637 [Dictyostelium purpureum]|eukprot:XP_003289881.1 hypothetical protein DICPUDRAFT_80637 [Dictyostelium purpureum]